MDREARELYFHEVSSLRGELHDLKTCQVTFLTFSVTAMGLLLGLATGLAANRSFLGVALLCPLVIVLPAWWVFFNKATTITRIVGYYRILETLIIGGPGSQHIKFIGWENGLRKYRQYQSQRKAQHEAVCSENSGTGSKNSGSGGLLQASHRYWLICYSIFFFLCLLCIVASVVASVLYDRWYYLIIDGVAAAVFLASAYYNARLVQQLTCGPQSYDSSEHLWWEVLRVETPPTKG